MDAAETRRGRKCWYKKSIHDQHGSRAFNDALLLESAVYFVLKKYFREKSYYTELVDVFVDVNHKVLYGQSLDTRTSVEKKWEE